MTIPIIIAIVLCAFWGFTVIAGAMKAAGWADDRLTDFDAGDGVPNAGDANCELQAGTGEPARNKPARASANAAVVNAPLSQSSPSARIVDLDRSGNPTANLKSDSSSAKSCTSFDGVSEGAFNSPIPPAAVDSVSSFGIRPPQPWPRK